MKSVLISIQPKWCELITSGKKTVEVRKTRPKLETPFKVYIYCTYGQLLAYTPQWTNEKIRNIRLVTRETMSGRGNFNIHCPYLNGKVIGEFVCEEITDMRDLSGDDLKNKCCMSSDEWIAYTDKHKGNVYGWHISDLNIYDKPKELDWFRKANGCNPTKTDFCNGCHNCEIKRPPQSWCYVSSFN